MSAFRRELRPLSGTRNPEFSTVPDVHCIHALRASGMTAVCYGA